ncbi:MAG: non-ribosomal peptide synthetase, partial [bacterium]|nr:non-ribosomal peptide synthetase [bacterium]
MMRAKRPAKKDVEAVLSLTPTQEGMLFHYLKDPYGNLYFEQLCLDMSGKIDETVFKKAWEMVIETNEMLRTVFRWEKVKTPVQIILKEFSFHLKYHDFSGGTAQGKKKLSEEVKQRDKEEPFDLRDTPFRITLCKIEKERYEIIISNHHILYDGWSSGIVLGEFFDAYRRLSRPGSASVPAVGLSKLPKPHKTRFKEFIRWIGKQDPVREEAFWKNYLSGFEDFKELPVKIKPGEGIENPQPYTYTARMGEETRHRLEGFAKQSKVTKAAIFYSAWGILLQRYTRGGDVVFGTTVSGRNARIKGIERMVGLFINTLPLRASLRPGEETLEFIGRINRELQSREAYENTSLIKLKEYLEPGGHATRFDTLLVIENYPLDSRLKEINGELSVNSYSMEESTNYDLTLGISVTTDIVMEFLYPPNVFEADTIKKMAGHFRSVLDDIISHPRRGIHHVRLLTEPEKKRLVKDFNDTRVDLPETKT